MAKPFKGFAIFVFRFMIEQRFSRQKQIFKLPPRRLEPLGKITQRLETKEVIETADSYLASHLPILLQKSPELQEIISAWEKLSDEAKNSMRDIVNLDINR